MKKYIIGIKYGDFKTRLVALSAPICVLLAIGFVVVAFITNIMPLFLGGLVFGIIAFAIHQNFEIEESTIDINPKEPKAPKEKKEKTKKASPEKAKEEPANVDPADVLEKPKENSPKNPTKEPVEESKEIQEDQDEAEDDFAYESLYAEEDEETQEEPFDDIAEVLEIATEKKEKKSLFGKKEKKEKKKKEKKPKPEKIKKEKKPKKQKPEEEIEDAFEEEETDEIGEILQELGMDTEDEPTEPRENPQEESLAEFFEEEEEEQAEPEPDEDEGLTEEEKKIKKKQNELQKYDKKMIKHYMYKYKVKRDHKTLIIDEWKEKQVHQAPAYIWTDRRNVHFLVIGEEAREFSVPLARANKLKLHKGVSCKAKEEYLQFRKPSMINTIFSPYLPAYNETEVNGRLAVTKNLFELGDGLMITAPSARVVMDMLQVDFDVDDIVMRDVRYNDFFKQVYKLGVMFREGMLPTKLYQNKINDILQGFADSNVSEKSYEDTLRQMYQHRLITSEYVDYYQSYRERKNRSEDESDTGKKHSRGRKQSRR